MKKTYHYLRDKYQTVRERPLTGKIIFIAMSVAATLWFLIRVIPKPTRATYPCMQAAAPIMSSFVIWLLAVSGSLASYRKAKDFFRRKRYAYAFVLVGLCLVSATIFTVSNTQFALAQLPQTEPKMHNAPNTPLGEGKGIFPGKVAWVHAPGVSQWDGENGFWFDDRWNDQAKADQLMASSITTLTATNSQAAAWAALFRHFNETHGKGGAEYRKGEKVVIKINTNNTTSHADSEELNTSPHLALALLRSLVYEAGVPQEDIVLCEPSRFITDNIFDKCAAEFPDVNYLDFEGGNGRIKVQYVADAIPYSKDNGVLARGLATCIVEADYLINCSLLKIHSGPGVTLTAKNWYGATDIDKNWRNNSHEGINQDRSGKKAYKTAVDFIGHRDLGQKTMLYIIDGLYGSRDVNGKPFPQWKMEPFNGDWACSLLVSQDPLAVDAVGLDLLAGEWPEVASLNYCDEYLVEAAMIPNAPSGMVYDPERDNDPLTAPLGVMEHWNNSRDKQYSRNLGKEEGIELVYHRIN